MVPHLFPLLEIILLPTVNALSHIHMLLSPGQVVSKCHKNIKKNCFMQLQMHLLDHNITTWKTQMTSMAKLLPFFTKDVQLYTFVIAGVDLNAWKRLLKTEQKVRCVRAADSFANSCNEHQWRNTPVWMIFLLLLVCIEAKKRWTADISRRNKLRWQKMFKNAVIWTKKIIKKKIRKKRDKIK